MVIIEVTTSHQDYQLHGKPTFGELWYIFPISLKSNMRYFEQVTDIAGEFTSLVLGVFIVSQVNSQCN